MKSLPIEQSEALFRTVAADAGWSTARVEVAARDAVRRLKAQEKPEPPSPWNLQRQVPEVVSTPALGPARAVRVRLASGKSVHVRMPEVATRRDVGGVARVGEQNARLHQKTLARHARALDELRERDVALERRIEDAQAQADLALLAALRGRTAVVQKLSEALQRVDAQERASRKLTAQLSYQAQASRGQNVRAAVSSMQVAAYGKRGSVFQANNLLLGASELLWGSVDTLLRRVGLWSRPEPAPLTWVGPVLGLLVGHVTLGQQQQERFVSGQLELNPLGDEQDVGRFAFSGSLDLRPYIASGHWDEFRQRPSVPATAQVTDQKILGLAVASVQLGTLQVLALGFPNERSVTVTWTVDVEAPGG